MNANKAEQWFCGLERVTAFPWESNTACPLLNWTQLLFILVPEILAFSNFERDLGYYCLVTFFIVVQRVLNF